MAAPDIARILSGLTKATILVPGLDDYNESLGSYFTALEQELKPACIVQPRTALEVSETIKALSGLSVQDSISVALRCGGHTCWAGSANVQNGVTIDLRHLTGVTLSDDKRIARVAGGEKWHSVHNQLKSQGLFCPGGRVPDTGVGGLTTGGGLSFYSTQRGFVCDNVMNFEVVLASGEIVNANARENSELWWALKGGSNNFGVVTAFHFTVFEEADLWGGMVAYDASEFPGQLEALYEFAHHAAHDELTQVMACMGLFGGHMTCLNLLYRTDAKPKPESLRPFFEVGKQYEGHSTLRIGSHKDFVDEIGKTNPIGYRIIYLTTSVKADLPLMNAVHTIWLQYIERFKSFSDIHPVNIWQPITPALIRRSEALGGNAMGISAADAPFFIININLGWGEKDDDEKIVQIGRELIDAIDAESAKRNLTVRYKYLNYAHEGQKIIDSYGEANKRRMQEVSQKYDPQGFFQSVVKGGFKLF